jgi:hypothetical protein
MDPNIELDQLQDREQEDWDNLSLQYEQQLFDTASER